MTQRSHDVCDAVGDSEGWQAEQQQLCRSTKLSSTGLHVESIMSSGGLEHYVRDKKPCDSCVVAGAGYPTLSNSGNDLVAFTLTHDRLRDRT